MHGTCLLVLFFISTRHYQNISSSSLPNITILSETVWELWPAQDFGFKGDHYIMKKVRVVSLACILFIPLNIIKLSQTVWELRPAQDFGFRGDNYITKTVRVVFACDTPTGPRLDFYKTLSKCLRISKLWSAHKDASTDGRHADRYIPRTYRLGIKRSTYKSSLKCGRGKAMEWQ